MIRRNGVYRLNEALVIEAPVSRVWDVITDLPRYGEWNPFVPAVRSTLDVGAPIAMKVHIFASFAQPQTETIFDNVFEERLCYGVPGTRFGAIQSRRCHVLETDGDARTRYASNFELSGWLAPMTVALVGRRIERGFRSMSAALKRRAEASEEARSSLPADSRER